MLADKVPSIRNFLMSYYDAEAVPERNDILLLRFYVKIARRGKFDCGILRAGRL